MDREKVIKGLEMCIKDIECTGCPYENDCFAPDDNPFGTNMMRDALALLKEQKAVKPILGKTGRIWLCGNCGSYVGFEDNDPHDPNEYDKYCRECGRPVLWEGR